jgi:hypothetical protein
MLSCARATTATESFGHGAPVIALALHVFEGSFEVH